MKPDERDAAYLWDMLEASRRIERLIAGLDYAAFVEDERTYLAIERLLENIGEAAEALPAHREGTCLTRPCATRGIRSNGLPRTFVG